MDWVEAEIVVSGLSGHGGASVGGLSIWGLSVKLSSVQDPRLVLPASLAMAGEFGKNCDLWVDSRAGF